MERPEAIAISAMALMPALALTIEGMPHSIGSTAINPQYSTVVMDLKKASVPIKELEGEGYVAVTLAAGRVVAMAFSKDGPDLLWSNPQLSETARVKASPGKLVGGFGGDRLWFAPELDYHWDGVPDWQGFTNYKTPAASDPGTYGFTNIDPDAVQLHAKGVLFPHGASQGLGFDVQRVIRMTEPPLSRNHPLMENVDYVGIETSHTLRIDEAARAGRMDLWHLLQMPIGSILIVPLNPKAGPTDRQPLSYGLPGGWVTKPDHLVWRYGGQAHAKLGLAGSALTGRTAILRQLEHDRWCLIVRQFSVDPKAMYGDHPYGVPRSDQVFQAWDGYGFGEMEYHSPLLDAQRGPRELTESDQLWAFGGTAGAIVAIASRLLGVDIAYLVQGTST